jgi:hypothetical protein
VSRMDRLSQSPALRGFAVGRIAVRPSGAAVWMVAALLVSFALAGVVLGHFGTSENGTALALRVTARWCFLLFWPAYAGGALAKVCGSRLGLLASHGRQFGLAFAAALLVHVGLVLWLLYVAPDQRSPMIFFWVGVFCTYALALLSVQRLHELLGPRLWRMSCQIALHYIALVFAVDFVVEPLRASGPDKYPLSYLPFVIVLAGGVVLRLMALAPRRQKA